MSILLLVILAVTVATLASCHPIATIHNLRLGSHDKDIEEPKCGEWVTIVDVDGHEHPFTRDAASHLGE